MKKSNNLFSILKGILLAVGITVAGVLLLSLFVKGNAEDNLISGMALVIKIVSVVAGTVLSGIKIRRRGALTGLLVAVPYRIICLLLTLLASPLTFSFKLLGDVAFTALIGIFAGILTVNTVK